MIDYMVSKQSVFEKVGYENPKWLEHFRYGNGNLKTAYSEEHVLLKLDQWVETECFEMSIQSALNGEDKSCPFTIIRSIYSTMFNITFKSISFKLYVHLPFSSALFPHSHMFFLEVYIFVHFWMLLLINTFS